MKFKSVKHRQAVMAKLKSNKKIYPAWEWRSPEGYKSKRAFILDRKKEALYRPREKYSKKIYSCPNFIRNKKENKNNNFFIYKIPSERIKNKRYKKMDEEKIKELPQIIEDEIYTGTEIETIFRDFDWENDENSRKNKYKYLNKIWYEQITISGNTHWQPHTEQNIFPKENTDFQIIEK